MKGRIEIVMEQMASQPVARRSQTQRREEMRQRLAAATLDALAEHGHAGASLSVILARAGVSRGAWSHHFETKAEMLALAAEGLLRDAIIAARTLALPLPADMSDPAARLSALLEMAWGRFYQGRHRDLLFEVVLAARTDAELRARLAPIFDAFIGEVGQGWGMALAPSPQRGAAMADLMVLTVYMLRGMAMQELAAGDTPHHAALRRLWVDMLIGFPAPPAT